MATGIVSVGLHLTGFEAVSWIFLALAAVIWVLLAVDFGSRLLWNRDRWSAEADTPPALTAVAATTVLGTRLALLGLNELGVALLVLATAVWPILLSAVMRHWQRGMPGAAFLVCVSTQGLAVLAATLALEDGRRWLMSAALICFCLGLLLYVAAFSHFDLPQIWTGSGDQWVATGALAISALAGSKLTMAQQWTGLPHNVIQVTTLIVLGLNMIGYGVLLLAEAIRPRPHYDIRRWATVFPLGMTAVATYSTGSAIHVDALRTVGTILLAVAVGGWLLTFVALLTDRTTFHPQHAH